MLISDIYIVVTPQIKYTFLKCSKLAQNSQLRRKCILMPLNVLSIPIPFVSEMEFYGPLGSSMPKYIVHSVDSERFLL